MAADKKRFRLEFAAPPTTHLGSVLGVDAKTLGVLCVITPFKYTRNDGVLGLYSTAILYSTF